MAYLQITSRCNFHCQHCAFSCTNKGEDMSLKTFRNAIKHFPDSIVIGGGEPTLHPKFWQILGECLGQPHSHCDTIWLATNGSNTNISIALANMAKKGIVACALSIDSFHDPINPEVIKAFQIDRKQKDYDNYRRNNNDLREIRNTESSLIKAGRCEDGEEGCICEDIFIKPNGNVHLCGCYNAPTIGNVNVNSSFCFPDDWSYGDCYKKTNVIAITAN